MGNSLQDQLLKVGLIDEKQARKAMAGKRPKQKQKKGNRNQVQSDNARAAHHALAQKATRDRELNQQLQAKAENKERRAQIRQLIEHNRLPRDEGEIGYHFEDRGKVRKLYITSEMHGELREGRLEIARLGGRYEVVSASVATQIRERDKSYMVSRKTAEPDSSEDDPYRDYKVPDDLMW